MTQSNGTLLRPGIVIDNKWIIIEMIGKGAMGEVYRAHQINLKRDVALKIISEEMLKELEDDPEETDIAFKRFHREVQTMAQVRHTNILNIFDYGVHADENDEIGLQSNAIEYIVMEYIPGDSLRFTMSEDGLDDDPELYADWVESYFLPILDGVEAMHNHNIFHRDLKPENIFMDGEIPKIADFGLARSYRMKAVSNSMEMKGTLTYMAPEQFTDFRKADQTADIYALGKLLYEGIDGKLDQRTLPMKKVSIQKYKNIDIPFLTKMDAVIQKATAEDKNARFQSVAELRTDLTKALALDKTLSEDDSSIQSKAVEFVQTHSRWVWAGIVLTLLSLGIMATWHLTGNPESPTGLKVTKGKISPHDSGVELPPDLKDLKKIMIAGDGSRMILTGDIEKTPLLYIDENKISNFLFVDFLNAVKANIVVENAIVKHNGIILIYLGPGTQEEDQIIYQHERFHLKDQTKGSAPVTRVSYHGAMEYAKYHGRALLTESEWQFSYSYHMDKYLKKMPEKKEEKPEPDNIMMHGTQEKEHEPEEIGILDGMGVTIKEWVRIDKTGESESVADINLFAGVIDSKLVKAGSKPVLRQQWEGFSDVGFRTKIPIK